MKISKKRLKEIIKEELSGLGEGDSADRKWASNPNNPEFEGDETTVPPHVRLQQVATSLGAHEGFVAAVRAAIATAVSAPESTGTDNAMMEMVAALEMLAPVQEADTPDEEEPLVLGKDGPPSREKIARQRQGVKRASAKRAPGDFRPASARSSKG